MMILYILYFTNKYLINKVLKNFCFLFFCRINFDYQKEDDWITSGKLGSREAVLVFRTNILNPKIRKTLSEKSSAQALSETKDNVEEPVPCQKKSEQKEPTSSETSSKEALSGSTQQKIYLLKTPQQCDKSDKLTFSSPFKKILNRYSSSDTSISSEGEEPAHSRECKSRVLKTSQNTINIKLAADLSKESGYESTAPAKSISNTEVSEEDPEVTSEDDDEYGVNMPAFKLKITYKFHQTETKLLRKLFNVHGLTEIQGESNNFNLLWTGVHMKLDIVRNLAPYQRVNHFPR